MKEENPFSKIAHGFIEQFNQIDLYKKEIIKELNKFKSTSEKINYLNSILIKLLDFQINNSNDLTIKGKIKEIKELIKGNEEIDSIENKKEMNKNETFDKTESNNKNKLNWTGQKNILIYIFQQLKKEKGNGNNFLISSSNEDIAVFLKENFNCFEDNKLSTIIGQLKKSVPPIKTSKKITIYF